MCSSLARCKHRLSQLSEGLKPGMDEPQMIAIVDYGAGRQPLRECHDGEFLQDTEI